MSTEVSDQPRSGRKSVGSVVHRYRREIRNVADATKSLSKKSRWFLVCIGIIAGVTIGWYFTRQHYKVQAAAVAVNGQVIYTGQLYSRLQQLYGVQIMRTLVAETLQIQFAKTKGVNITRRQVLVRFAEISSAPNANLILQVTGMTPRLYNDLLLSQMSEEAVFDQGVTVSDADVQKYYKEQSDPKNRNGIFFYPATISLEVIGAASESDAEAALSQINSQVPFSIVAERYSQDSSRDNGGQLAPLTLGRNPLSQIPSVETQVFNTPIGQVLGPLNFGRRYWLFKVLDKTPARVIPFNQVEKQARRGARLAKGIEVNGKTIAGQFAEFQKAANLQDFTDQYGAALRR
jgi:parvulin-like peptidyl-prolyl isomerase